MVNEKTKHFRESFEQQLKSMEGLLSQIKHVPKDHQDQMDDQSLDVGSSNLKKRKITKEERSTWFKKPRIESPKENTRIVTSFDVELEFFPKEENINSWRYNGDDVGSKPTNHEA
ncbi:hypothetical protein L1987_40685 [Smallanthus sonchifolius]|uniref:Uncharacterized protein n=1 Tax=Smallanthus sonchifolius TaxID=185202 RepID=A0ACB9GUI9_9ASTR|nr:hypothetical protein L1987_40685 [Smallanthus sonchifolius]